MPQVAALIARWNVMPRGVRATCAAVAALAATIALIAGVALRAPRVALFATPLHPEQLAEVEERLASWNVPFAPTSDNAIVDAGRRNDLLLRLSLAGVPHAHLETTQQAMAGIGALTPQAVIDAQTRAGLAGDIEEGLRGLDGIDDARVIVVPAKTAEFADQSARDATASVRLRLRAGTQLSRESVEGIRAFVAAGVAGLDPAHVTILDDAGVALGPADQSDGSELQAQLQSALDAAFGTGATIVRVRAEYRGEAMTVRDERREPLAGAAIERTDADERYDDGGKRYRRNAAHDVRGSESRESTSQTPAGSLARISTAVFVDRIHVAELAAVRDLAAATVGYDARRGDALAVEAVDFSRPDVPRKDLWWLLYGAIVPLLPAIAIALGLLGALRALGPPALTAARAVFERFAVERTSKAVAGFTPSRVRNALEHEPPHAAAAIISALPAATAAAVLELYPIHERDAIVRRMQRPHSPFHPDAEEILRSHV